MDAIDLVESLGGGTIKVDDFTDGGLLSLIVDGSVGNELGFLGSRAPEELSVISAVLNDLLPLVAKEHGLVSHPVHVIEKDELGDLGALVSLEELRNGGGVEGDVVDDFLELGKVGLLAILRAAIREVLALHVDAPEVVIVDGKTSEDGLEGVTQELSNVHLGGQQVLLSNRDTNTRESSRVLDNLLDNGVPELLLDALVINLLLLLDSLGAQQIVGSGPQTRDGQKIDLDQPSESTRAGTEVEGRTEPGAIKVVRVIVPELLGLRAQTRTQLGVDLLRETRQQSISPHLPEGRVIQLLDSRNLQLQASILTGVTIDTVDMLRSSQHVIQSIATS